MSQAGDTTKDSHGPTTGTQDAPNTVIAAGGLVSQVDASGQAVFVADGSTWWARPVDSKGRRGAVAGQGGAAGAEEGKKFAGTDGGKK